VPGHPKLGEREVVAALLAHERARLRPGLLILADKGFAGRDFERLVAGYGAALARPDRADEPHRFGSLGRWRQWIESTFDTLKDQLGWNAMAAGPWLGWWSGSPNACSRWPRRSGGTGRSAHQTSAP
jgi:hypothetical protein